MTPESVRTHVLVPFACSPVCPDAQILNLSDSAQGAGANAKAGQYLTWRELEEALETSTSTDHVRRALALNKHLLHGQSADRHCRPSYSFVCPSMLFQRVSAHSFQRFSYFLTSYILSLDPSNTACP